MTQPLLADLAPKRIQLSRAKGWRKPENTVVVSRPTKWGNTFAIGTYCEGELITNAATAVRCFREMLTYRDRNYPSNRDIVSQLRGKNLACWRPLGSPCHADVLLRLANKLLPAEPLPSPTQSNEKNNE